MHCLFISSLLPEPEPRTGFEIANRAILRAFEGAGARVTPVGFRRPGGPQPQPGEILLGDLEIENAGAAPRRKAAWLARALAARLPVAAAKLRVLSPAALMERIAAAGPFDALILNSVQMPAAYPFLTDLAPSIFVAHNVEHVSAAQNARAAHGASARLLYGREAQLLKDIEARLCARAGAVLTLSQADLGPLGLEGDPKAFALPLAVGRGRAADSGVREHDVGLIGTWSWAPNRAGLDWFVQEVAPRLSPRIRVAVAGNLGAAPPAAPASVAFLGRVPDAQRFVSASRVLALATKGGTGIQLKTLETLEEGMPAVATTPALRGIDGSLPPNIAVADDAAEFAAALERAVEAERAGRLPRLDGQGFSAARQAQAVRTAAAALARLEGQGRLRLRPAHAEPRAASAAMPAEPSVALVTSTYRGDLERCRLLCDSIDRRVTGHSCHYLLVEDRDRALFAGFEGPQRRVLTESELLPRWLRPVRHPFRPGTRLWVHPFGLPLHGWHAQQLRRIAVAQRLDDEVMLSCDSDVVFVRAFDARSLVREERVVFHRVPDGLDTVSEGLEGDHLSWSRRAGRLLGIEAPKDTRTGYITNMVAWRTDTARAMAARIAEVAGRPAMRALAADRALSECVIYGRFVEEVENRPDRHLPTADSLVSTRWHGETPSAAEIEGYVAGLRGHEVAFGIQSFIGTDPALIRAAVGLA